jgi:hypothetical protein
MKAQESTIKTTKTKIKKVKTLNLPKRLFWDVEYDKIDWDDKWFWVIERVIQRGDMSDFGQVFHYYGRVKVKFVAKDAKYFDTRTLNFLKDYFKLQKSQIKCYSTPPSVRALWPY